MHSFSRTERKCSVQIQSKLKWGIPNEIQFADKNLANQMLPTSAVWILDITSLLVDFSGLGQGRRKRSHWRSYYYGCSGSDFHEMNICLRKVGPFNVKLSCQYRTNYCTYVATCRHQPQKAEGNLAPGYLPGYSCSNIRHVSFGGICCSPIC